MINLYLFSFFSLSPSLSLNVKLNRHVGGVTAEPDLVKGLLVLYCGTKIPVIDVWIATCHSSVLRNRRNTH
jgi:hypothetical protein